MRRTKPSIRRRPNITNSDRGATNECVGATKPVTATNKSIHGFDKRVRFTNKPLPRGNKSRLPDNEPLRSITNLGFAHVSNRVSSPSPPPFRDQSPHAAPELRSLATNRRCSGMHRAPASTPLFVVEAGSRPGRPMTGRRAMRVRATRRSGRRSRPAGYSSSSVPRSHPTIRGS